MKPAKEVWAPFLALILSMAMLPAKSSAESINALDQVHYMRMANFTILEAFYRYSALPELNTLDEIDKATQETSKRLLELSSEKGHNAMPAESTSKVIDELKVVVDLEQQNIQFVRKNKYADTRLTHDMAIAIYTLDATLAEVYDDIIKSGAVTTNETIEAARNTSITLAKIMTQFAARATSITHQSFPVAGDENKIDKQAETVDSLLSRIMASQKKLASDSKLYGELENIKTKWAFIRGSYLNYTEATTSFAVDYYSKSILKSLSATIALLVSQIS